METSYKTTLKCGACLSKVTPGLNQVQGLLHWSIDLNDPDKRLRVRVDDPAVLDHVVAAVRQAGFDAVRQGDKSTSQAVAPSGGLKSGMRAGTAKEAMTAERSTTLGSAMTAERSTTLLRTYWPLILVLVYVVGGVLYTEWIAAGGGWGGAGHGWSWHRAMSSFMGFFFVGFAFFKLLDVTSFADAFASYDVVAARSRSYGLAYPFIELALGLAYLLSVAPLATHLATIAVMGMGLVGVVRAVMRRQAIQCACLGTVFNLPMSSVTIVENSTMIAMAVVMLAVELAGT